MEWIVGGGIAGLIGLLFWQSVQALADQRAWQQRMRAHYYPAIIQTPTGEVYVGCVTTWVWQVDCRPDSREPWPDGGEAVETTDLRKLLAGPTDGPILKFDGEGGLK